MDGCDVFFEIDGLPNDGGSFALKPKEFNWRWFREATYSPALLDPSGRVFDWERACLNVKEAILGASSLL